VGAGTVVAFAGDHSPDAAALLLAIFEAGAIAVPLGRGAVADDDERLAIAGVEVMFDRGKTVRSARPALYDALGGAGLVVFSSGSSGAIKGVLHDVPRLLERYRKPRPARRALAFLLLDHLGGIHTVLHTLAHGGTLVAVEERTQDVICAAIERHRVQLLPASPTFLHMLLLAEGHRRFDLSSLELITYGTEVMPETTLRRLGETFPGVRLEQTYGLTELGVFPSRSRASDSLWVRVGGDGIETRVEAGELWIRARTAMVGYLNAPSPFDADGWYNTHDRVLVDGEYLRFLGRDSDLINVGGEKVYPAEVESVLAELPNVREATVFAHPSPVTGHVVAARLLLAEPEEPGELRRRVREFCTPRLARYKIPVRVEIAAEPAIGERWKKVRPHGA
jgi:acyl-CoA synthetase (AMP-forming)/AMP-acid ligase II